MPHVHTFRLRDCVVSREEKRDTQPGPGARDVRPEPHGEGYRFVVDEFWRVGEVQAGQLLLLAPRGKTRIAETNDPHLHVVSCGNGSFTEIVFPKPRCLFRREAPDLPPPLPKPEPSASQHWSCRTDLAEPTRANNRIAHV